ncbi:MAG: hypothetical protein HYX75_07885 [Acidobacteria bacterium]|nr:hypothetical protein [Acidobacteriota bacterium]
MQKDEVRRDRPAGANKVIFIWMGSVCLMAIVAIKLVRLLGHPATSLVIGIAPSVLGPAGLLFLLLSSTGRLSRLTLLQMTVLVAALSVALERIQLLPRPPILARGHYTFDFWDIGGTVLSVVAGYSISARILRQPQSTDRKG